jgi:hypothetical protein
MKKIKSVYGLEYAALFCVLVVLSFFLYRYVNYTLDSDAASELVLAKMLADNGEVLSKSWLYSTELRVLNTQLIWTPLMALGLSWHSIRVVGSIIMYVLVLLALWFMLKKAQLSQCFPAVGIMLLLPLSQVYFNIFLEFVYYIPHVTISLLTIGLLLGTLRADSRGRMWVLTALNLLLAILAGMGGLRQLVVLYVPLVLAAVAMLWLNKRSKDSIGLVCHSGALLVGALVGYGINSVWLSKIYSFSLNESISFKEFSLSGIEKMINGMLNIFGYRSGTGVMSVNLIYSGFACILLLTAIFSAVRIIRNRADYNQGALLLACFFLACQLILTLVYSMTSMAFLDRYLIPTAIFAYPVIFACFENRKSFPASGRYIAVGLLVVALLCGAMNYNDMRKVDDTKGQREAVEAIVEQGYTQGYATFWNANVLTELSNGRLEMWQWSDSKQVIDNLDDFNDVYPWLQAKSHLESVPDGKMFILLSANEDYYFNFTDKLSDEYVIYRADNYYDYGFNDYIVYGFDSYEQLAELLSK